MISSVEMCERRGFASPPAFRSMTVSRSASSEAQTGTPNPSSQRWTNISLRRPLTRPLSPAFRWQMMDRPQRLSDLIDPVDFEIAAVRFLHQPGGQWPGKRDVGTRTGDEPADAPFRRVVAQQSRKPWKQFFGSVDVALKQHGMLRQRGIAIGSLDWWKMAVPVQCMPIRGKTFPRSHHFAEMQQPARFARRVSNVRLDSSNAVSIPVDGPGKKAH